DRSKELREWEAGTGREVRLFQPPVEAVDPVFSDDCELAAFYSLKDNTVCILEVASRRKLRSILCRFELGSPMAFSPDKRLLAIGESMTSDRRFSSDRTVDLYDVTTGKEVRNFALPTGPEEKERSGLLFTFAQRLITFSPDNRIMAATYADDRLVMW